MESKSQILDPESFAEVLKLYAQAMHVAVALTDPEGRLMGICHNPQEQRHGDLSGALITTV